MALGHVDLCVGDFWVTPERRNISTMTAMIAMDTFVLVSKSTIATTSTSQFFGAIFMPFEPTVWIL